MNRKISRRTFLQNTTAVASAVYVGNQVSFADAPRSANEQLNFASVGVGGKGTTDAAGVAKYGKMVGICDIDDKHLGKSASIYKEAAKYNDYREMFDKMEGKVDAITVTTPDHMHAPISIAAMEKGIHVYCQKPLVHSVAETRQMRKIAKENEVITAMGNQGTTIDDFREAVEIIQSGVIGDVSEVHVWTNRPGKWWKQAIPRPKETPAIPKHVHWDLFLGVAPERPYNPIYHPFKWRGWVDFGTGAIGDMACHTMNMAVMALDLFDPETVEVESPGIVENETFPMWGIYKYQFPKTEKRPAVKLFWYEGNKFPPTPLFQGNKPPGSGLLLVGEKGTAYSPNDYGGQVILLPKEDFKDFKKPERKFPRVNSKCYKEFADACKGGNLPLSNFEYGARLTETALLGLVALDLKKKIEWDAENMSVKNCSQKSIFLDREYRTGWA